MHKTQQAEQLHHDEEKVFAPTEDLQRSEGGIWQKSFRPDSQPKTIRWIGYVIVGFVLMTMAIVILNFFNE
jgi:hypothetical protein